VRAAIEALAGKLEKAGAKVARNSPLLPDLEAMARTYYTLLNSVFSADLPIDVYERIRTAAAGSPASDVSLEAVGVRGLALSHRDWIWANRVRNVVAQRWRALFGEFDVVACPILPTVAFAHDHSEPQRAQARRRRHAHKPAAVRRSGPASRRSPASPRPRCRLRGRPKGCPSGSSLSVPISKIAPRSPLRG